MSTPKNKSKKSRPFYNKQVAALGKFILDDLSVIERVETELSSNPLLKDCCVVFISVCNMKNRALVFKGTGPTPGEAWKNAEIKVNNIIRQDNFKVVWVKADIVNSAEEIPVTDLNKAIIEHQLMFFFRKGIALDPYFDTAFLEAEINGNRLIDYYTEQQMSNNEIDYDSVRLDLPRINRYLKDNYGVKGVSSIPDKIITFTTIGYFCDENLDIHRLHDKGFDFGRRIIEKIDKKAVDPVMISAAEYLFGMIKPDGEYIYGYHPIAHKEISDYNILRHAGSIWSLINLYRITRNDALIDRLNSAIDYLTDGHVVYKEENVAFVYEKKSDEIKLGGNGLTIIMLTEYMDVFETDRYVGLVSDLANGILEMENPDTGEYFHVWNYPDFSPKEEFRTIYYDGEATFALTRAYTYTKDEKYLNGAKMAVENLIAKDYTKHMDHWVSYALNEITKYIPDIRYFEFAMQNAGNNFKRIYNRARSAQTNLELLMMTWQTYRRITELKITSPYLDEFDVGYLARTIYQRARHLLNGFFYPEFAMYMDRPNRVVGSFFVREDRFRIRIDDIQHYIGGYYFYSKYFEEILPHLSQDFLDGYNA